MSVVWLIYDMFTVSNACSYLDILVSLVQGGGAVDAAVSAAAVAGVQNMVANGAPPQQKRAYKALCALMQGDLQARFISPCSRLYRTSFAPQADASSNIITLVTSTVGSVSAAARPARMRAISLVLKHKAVEIVTNGSLVSRLLGEVMLSCKDPSKKTRDAAFEALVSVAKASETAGKNLGVSKWRDLCCALCVFLRTITLQ